ncbi:hypothetical protein [Klebsiella pneumoniae]|uniref:hypothetical protein n=1 Tax=Klebsiella pneumoniae TaxID=573 RepID=UPI0007CD24AF|nr:hypothetical protein [Klebsiella pneumoniae]SAV37115.1 Uncharacterised protein [Klebsiella pneumoniae]
MVWRVAKSLLILRDQINQYAPHRNTDSDGTIGDEHHAHTNSDHNPQVIDGNIGVVTAIDITHDPQHKCDAQAIVDALVASKDKRIKALLNKSNFC